MSAGVGIERETVAIATGKEPRFWLAVVVAGKMLEELQGGIQPTTKAGHVEAAGCKASNQAPLNAPTALVGQTLSRLGTFQV
jgi:hypothetical protein